jgi:hypothetical protein
MTAAERKAAVPAKTALVRARAAGNRHNRSSSDDDMPSEDDAAAPAAKATSAARPKTKEKEKVLTRGIKDVVVSVVSHRLDMHTPVRETPEATPTSTPISEAQR